MTTREVINENYDRNLLSFIFVATFSVIIVLTIAALVGAVGFQWLILPATWWVGAIMVWAHSKWLRSKK